MATDRQMSANRNNAEKSTGPRSKAGREKSRHNARQHGLAIHIGTDPAFRDDIERLSKALFPGSGPQNTGEHARAAAEAELDLLRIRKIRAWLFETLYFENTAAQDCQTELNDKLAKLERYERRAYSRRKRALRAIGSALPQ